MNLRDVKRLTVEMSGRVDLVQNETTYADAGVMEYISAGQRFLEDYRDLPHMKSMSAVGISTGEWSVNDPYLKYVEEVWVVNVDGTRVKLTRDEGERYERQSYPSVSPGTPAYYQVQPSRLAHEEILQDSCLLNYATTWSFPANTWNVSGRWATHVQGNVDPFEQDFSSLLRPPIENDVCLLGYTIKGIDLPLTNAVTASISGTSGVARDRNGRYYETIKAGAYTPYVHFLPHTDFVGSIGEFTCKRFPQDDNESVFRGSWDETFNAVIVLPPADKSYVVELYGSFYTPPLETDGDVNYWTLHYPIVLASAANFFIEGGMRNSQGLRDFMEFLEITMRGMKAPAILQAVEAAGVRRRG